MGDRSYVNLLVLQTQAEKARKIFDRAPDEESDDIDNLVNFGFSEVNYGQLSFLQKLRDAGIAYSSNYDSGYEYRAGTASCRFTSDGDLEEKDISDDDINPPLDSLLHLIDEPDVLREFILNHKERVSVLDWDNQEEYGKRYLAKKLITS